MTVTSAKIAGGRRQAYWTRDKIIEKIRRWVELYGEPPRAADWNPSSAKWAAQTWRIERYEKGDPETGDPWPSLNAAKKAFRDPETGKPSLNAAVKAAGYKPNRHGPPKRSEAGPTLDEGKIEMHPLVRVALEDARRRATEAEAKVEVRERQLEGVRNARDRAQAERDALRARKAKAVTKTKTKTKTRTVVREDAAAKRRLDRAEAKLADAEQAAKEAKAEKVVALRDATRMAARLERAEATVTEVRAERREMRDELARVEDRVAAQEKTVKRLRGELDERPETEVREVVRVEREVVELPAPEAKVVEDARKLADEAERRIEAAELRAAQAERKYMEIAEAATGEARRLTPAEMGELRKGGPSGPVVLGEALAMLAKARKQGGKQPLREALGAVASAAIRWKDRL